MRDDSLIKSGIVEATNREWLDNKREWLDNIEEWCNADMYSIYKEVQRTGRWLTIVRMATDINRH